LHLLIDSTGLKLFGKGEWDSEKHGRARRSWRKLHLAVDAETGEIVASVLTGKEAGDAGQVPVLLEQVEGEIASVMADGAYDGEPVYQAITARQPQAAPEHCDPAPPLSRSQLSGRHGPEPAGRSHPPHPRAGPLGVARRRRSTESGAWLRRRSAATRP
jgi:hypothetical protein